MRGRARGQGRAPHGAPPAWLQRLRLLALFVTTAGFFCGPGHGTAVTLVAPGPATATGAPPAQRGVVAYPNYGDAQSQDAARHEALGLVHAACKGAYRVWAEDSSMDATEQAEANRQGVTFPRADPVWLVRFACLTPLAGQDPNGPSSGPAPPPPAAGK